MHFYGIQLVQLIGGLWQVTLPRCTNVTLPTPSYMLSHYILGVLCINKMLDMAVVMQPRSLAMPLGLGGALLLIDEGRNPLVVVLKSHGSQYTLGIVEHSLTMCNNRIETMHI